MKSRNRGFTLLELIIVCAILLILGAFIFQVTSCGGEDYSQEVSQQAANTAQQMGYKDVMALCEGVDSDGDGKVSCTITHTLPDGTRASMPFLCPSRWSRSSTCQVRGFGW